MVLGLEGCVTQLVPPGEPTTNPSATTDEFVMPDGARLPYRAWLPNGEPEAVILALHGMNDSRDAWEIPGPAFAEAGIAVFAPDQRGFGGTESRAFWAGADGLVADTRAMAQVLRRQFPRARLVLMGESMGAAVLMVLATQPDAPSGVQYVLIAPAVWGRAKMNALMQATLWVAANTVPGMRLDGRGLVRVTASDNIDALRRLSTNPLTIKGTRVDAVRGLVDLMDAALESATRFRASSLFLYGGRDELIPPKATAATWNALPAGPVRAFYPDSYHLALRDLGRTIPIQDIVAWIQHPEAPLPSGADRAAETWLGQQE